MAPWSYSMPAEPGPNHVDVEISHCGICHSDVHQIDNAWGVACFPLVPGHEIVGTVVKVGSNVSNLIVGETVGIGVQRSNCGVCVFCLEGKDHICPKIGKTYAGPGKDKGGFAEYIRYPADWVFKIPSSYSRAHAAPLLCAGITTYSPLKKYVQTSEAVVGIIGVGGLGHVAIQIAAGMTGVTMAKEEHKPKLDVEYEGPRKDVGVKKVNGWLSAAAAKQETKKVLAKRMCGKNSKVVAISTSLRKKDECLGLGATDFLVSTDATEMAKWAGKFDVLLNTVSGVFDLDAYLALLKPDGVFACVGLPEKDQKCGVFMQSFVITERQIVGSYLGPKADYEEMFEFCDKHNVKPMVEEFEMEQLNEAIEKLRKNDLRYRAVLKLPASKKL
eukprot:gnl/MRDRNA2_/MRDRNA2_30431_c0_seq1.p1 gnl/MRDRNA2_/MRDRNA2_30431_c0~~gnl/MRDRNA2_/MRDRNA2_30431_c0_seq1.p1  ORF type:complete len:423 (+),score=92.38 gnl/MRDRNA2_/MRDRNA2_30431_c0_seq1:109-1269(+)